MGSSGRGILSPGAEMLSVGELAEWAPRLPALLHEIGVPYVGNESASLAFLCAEAGVDPADVFEQLEEPDAAPAPGPPIERVELIGGRDKTGAAEPVKKLTIRAGQAVALVGATGSGKSQVLADIESLTQGGSPSGRVVLLDGRVPPEDLRWSPAAKPVAQLSQGMTFLLDATVAEFLEMHASIRRTGNRPGLVAEVVAAACSLCGESFDGSTPLAFLSGGQSRALMIADAALVGSSPIILIDEIENAGIDRERALQFLLGQGKIALLATHDPLLALKADARVILRQGGMQEVLTRSDSESEVLLWLEQRERGVFDLREALRAGERMRLPRPILARLDRYLVRIHDAMAPWVPFLR
ncbi:MAG: ATP-binding cassette domain-containing protein [bacterium]